MGDAEFVEEEGTPSSVGQRLREAREASGLSLEDIATQTRIPTRHLESLEAGDFSRLPAPTYSIGFAKNFGFRLTGARRPSHATNLDLGDEEIAMVLPLMNDGSSVPNPTSGHAAPRVSRAAISLKAPCRKAPPMPIDRTFVNLAAPGGLIFPPCTSAANDLIVASVSVVADVLYGERVRIPLTIALLVGLGTLWFVVPMLLSPREDE